MCFINSTRFIKLVENIILIEGGEGILKLIGCGVRRTDKEGIIKVFKFRPKCKLETDYVTE